MSLLVDTSVWSLALRRDTPPANPHVETLLDAFRSGVDIYVTGIILQELLQGFAGASAQEAIVERFAALPTLVPETRDHIAAAEVRNRCRRKGVQVGTIDALIAQLAIRYELDLLSTDKDFRHMAKILRIKLAL